MCAFNEKNLFAKVKVQLLVNFVIHNFQFISNVLSFPQASPNIVIALAGNKADLSNIRVVEFDEAKQYAEENGLLFMETSAKTGMNVNDIFLAIGE